VLTTVVFFDFHNYMLEFCNSTEMGQAWCPILLIDSAGVGGGPKPMTAR